MINRLREVPPTAGLTLSCKDVLPSKKSLESSLASFLNTPTTQIECSGTAALTIALLALKKSSARQTVIISAYTCPWVPIAVIYCGLTPVVCDTKKNTFEYCPDALVKSINQDTLAVVVTHLGGHVASNLGEILKLAKQQGSYLIEDAAQSLGARFGKQFNYKAAGTVCDIGFYSLGVGKGLTIFAGGVLVAKDESLRKALRETSTEHAHNNLLSETKRIIELVGYYLFYRPLGIKWVFGLPLRRHLLQGNMIKAVGDDCAFKFPIHKVSAWRKNIGANALARLPIFLKQSQIQAQQRIQQLKKIKGLIVVCQTNDHVDTYPFIYVLMPSEQVRDAALKSLWQQGLGVGRLFIHAISDYDYLKSHFQQSNTPNAQDFAARGLIISNSQWMREQDFLQIQQILLQYA
ncbi:DegT/DnrJ/EryC1/StrS family aminotransferase [Methylotenera sp.]|uniref:DegT/DnrJ/EryC1/StrS family aminotransferase n=1 Tax=Methylotenera sp. TaxID=2051956 RepID=UPI002489C3D7|nr:DegT/DnrJ/EryC1/StrS family aminotransferase [Methylotenera sp.]MDI1298317.1 DegT/DnrJ/EryC1/StrS family aminotransferase [Methylotenera sp.]